MTEDLLKRATELKVKISNIDQFIRNLKDTDKIRIGDYSYNKVEVELYKDLRDALISACLSVRDKYQEEFNQLGDGAGFLPEPKGPSLLERIQSWINEHF